MPMIRAGRLGCLVLGFVLVVGLVSDNSWGLADTSPAESAAEASPPEDCWPPGSAPTL